LLCLGMVGEEGAGSPSRVSQATGIKAAEHRLLNIGNVAARKTSNRKNVCARMRASVCVGTDIEEAPTQFNH
jgi:hypothetical protein